MRSLVTVLAASLAMTFAAVGQEAPVSTIETEGVAVLDTAPMYAEFWLHAQPQGQTLAEAAEGALGFEPAIRKEIQARELTPSELTFSGVAIPSVQAKEARISVRIRFSASAFNSPTEGPRQFALLCDKIAALAAALSCKAEGPFLGVDDPESVEHAGVARATEKAYPAAKAAAQIMNGQIIAVDKVAVQDVTWNKAPGVNAAQPDIRRLTCTVRVKVQYVFAPAQP
jgi:hypothetical protein